MILGPLLIPYGTSDKPFTLSGLSIPGCEIRIEIISRAPSISESL